MESYFPGVHVKNTRSLDGIDYELLKNIAEQYVILYDLGEQAMIDHHEYFLSAFKDALGIEPL